MANKTTILDIIQSGVSEGQRERTDERIRLARELAKEEGYTKADYHTPSEFYRKADRKLQGKVPEITQAYIDEAMAEKNPTAGGRYEGSVYYSNKLPKGKGKVKYNKKDMDMLSAAAASNRTPGGVGKAQEFLASIGYIEPSQIDSIYGPVTRGAIQRYKYNATDVDAIYDAMEIWKDRLFD